jgi:hypothetical protein
MHWDQKLTKELVDAGLSWEHARIVVGIIAEQRLLADHEGYIRGYNDGFNDGKDY